jgi:PleD family two-component response regulator
MDSTKPPGVIWFDDANQSREQANRAVQTALVVDQQLMFAMSVLNVLTTEDFRVTVADSFLEAKLRLTQRPPDLIVTALVLGEYNGLGLVLRGKSIRSDMAGVVIASKFDPVLQAEAEAIGATFVTKPVSDRDLRAAILRTLFQRVPVKAPFERRCGDRRQRALNVDGDRRSTDRRRPTPTLLHATTPAPLN